MSEELSSGKNTEDLIDSLCCELKPVCVLSHPLKRVIPWLILAILYVCLSVCIIGFRFDINTMMHKSTFVFELFFVAIMAISASLSSVWLCVPDMRGQKWMVAVPFTLFSMFSVWMILRAILDPFHIPLFQWHFCLQGSVIFGVLPAVTIFLLSLKGRTTHPHILSIMISLAIGSLGYIGLRLVCASEDIGHIFFTHTAPYIAFSLMICLIGNRIYRW